MGRCKYLLLAITVLFSGGCARSSSQTWEDVKTAGRYMQRSFDALFGKEYESKLLTSDEEFIGPYEQEFIPLRDADLCSAYKVSDNPLPQPKKDPGESGVPNLAEFMIPPDALKNLFLSMHFDTADHNLKNKAEVEGLMRLANYLQQNGNVLLTIEGHCDERGSASYNISLGMRRANSVRAFLVKQGIDLNRVYTVSRGKEQPLALGHSSQDWKLNRRTEFKIYRK